MSEDWLEVEVRISAAGVDLVCALLHDFGCTGVIVEETSLDTFVPQNHELVSGQDYQVKAYFFEPRDLEPWRKKLQDKLLEIGPYISEGNPVLVGTSYVKNKAWAEDWKQHFTSFRVGKHLVFRPTWEDSQVSDGDIYIKLDPGMAFGTGTHPTTRLCLDSLSQIFEKRVPPQTVLDVGTGSGILAMAAAAFGASDVIGCDVDETAREVARQNISMNALEDRVSITDAGLSEIDRQFDMVMANILAEEIIRLASNLVKCLKNGGWLILSGILVEKEALIEKGFSPFPLELPQITRLEDWSCFIFQKRD